jgi:o-succinylbenzoate synthase
VRGVIEAVELRRVALPLVTPFRTSFGTQTVRDALLVRVITDQGEGWGECVAGEEPLYSSEYADAAQHVLRHHLIPRLLAGRPAGEVKGHAMAKAALELATLDAHLRATGTSLRAHLGGDKSRLEVGVSVGIFPTERQLRDQVAAYVEAGYRRVKLKIEPGSDVAPVRAVRKAHPDLMLQVDANAAYTRDSAAESLKPLDDEDLLLIEQPLPEDDLQGHADLAALLHTPLCLDESITSRTTAALALDLGACAIVNIKAGRVGGYAEAVRIHDLCLARRIPVWCGGMLETGIGRAANLALASLPGFTLPGDISATDRYFATDITEPFVLEDGCLDVPTGPGIGVTPDPQRLEQHTTSVDLIRI